MKKIGSLLILFTISIGLSSCGSSPNPCYVLNNYDLKSQNLTENDEIEKLTLTVNNDDLINYASKKMSYILYVGSPNCSYCQEFLPTLKKFIINTKYQILYYNAAQNILSKLIDANQKVYGHIQGTPDFSFYVNGEYIASIPTGRMTSYDLFKPAVDSYVKSTNIQSGITSNALLSYKDTNDTNIYFMSNSDELSLDTYHNYIFDKIKEETNKNYIFYLDKASASDIEALNNAFLEVNVVNGSLLKIVNGSISAAALPSNENYIEQINIILNN